VIVGFEVLLKGGFPNAHPGVLYVAVAMIGAFEDWRIEEN
jgi:hypothetical protein